MCIIVKLINECETSLQSFHFAVKLQQLLLRSTNYVFALLQVALNLNYALIISSLYLSFAF